LKKQTIGSISKLTLLIQLTRLDKPIGIFLLLWPTLTGLWIAAEGIPSPRLLFIFTLGVILMRSAGCCVNDFADHKFDAGVERTKNRPLASGALRRQDALIIFGGLVLCGFFLVLFTNLFTIVLAVFAAGITAIYPFMKRYTNLPQVVLGVAFSMGILMAFSATSTAIPTAAYLLFIANIVWTVAYDTEYAMVDREYDIRIGVKSTAILFGDADRLLIGLLQGLYIIAMWMASAQFELGIWVILALIGVVALFAYQQFLIRNRKAEACFKAFLNNNWVGALVFAGVVLNYL